MKDFEKNFKKKKDKAIEFVRGLVEESVGKYNEPTRAGIPKGEPIGFSLEKYRTALWMVIYNKHHFELNDISKLANVSRGVLLVWRTEEDFKEKIEDFCRLASKGIINQIENALANESQEDIRILKLYQEILPFLNQMISITVMEWVMSRMEEKSEDLLIKYFGFMFGFLGNMYSYNKKALRRWEVNILGTTKFLINCFFEYLSSPEYFSDFKSDPKRSKKIVEDFRNLILGKMDILAG